MRKSKHHSIFNHMPMTRRQFAKVTGALGATAFVMPSLYSKPAKADPVKGGQLKISMQEANATDTLDPAKFTSSIDAMRGMELYNRLVHVTPEMKLRGELAETFEPNATADQWTFKLREGVTFHNGRPFVAADVMFTVKRILNPATGSALRGTLQQVDMGNSKMDGDHVVVFKLKAPNADFPTVFHDFHAQIVPDGTTNFDKGIGTGPFVLKSFEPGAVSVAERNPNYWKSGLPYLDAIETSGVPDQTARLNALLAGEIHVMEGVTGTIIDRVTSSPELQLLSAKSGRHVDFVMNCETNPYSNADVRTGLKYLIDRDKYVQVVLKGQGQPGNDQPISPIDPWYCPDIPMHTYDPDKAKFYLKKGGADSASFSLSTSTVTGNLVEAALFYQQMADQAGVKINIVREPPDSYWSNVWLKKPFCMVTWNQRPTADMIFSIVYQSTADWNDTHWRRPEFDKIIAAARGELDHTKRMQLYCEAEKMIHDDGGAIIPGFENVMDAALKKVHGLQLHPLGPLGFWQTESVWLES